MFDEDKTDRNDAFRSADFLRIQRFTTSFIKEEKYMALQRLTRTRYQLIKQLVRTKQHFLENLAYKCNTLTRELKELDETISFFSSSVMSLITDDFSLDELAEMKLQDFVTLLQEKVKGRFKNPEVLAKEIQRDITMSYRLGTIDIILSVLVREIRALESILRTWIKRLNNWSLCFLNISA